VPDLDVSPTFDVLGCTLVGPPPLRGCELRFDGSVTALYGLNGAGKSTVLDAVRAALTGIRGRSAVQIHLRIRDSVQTLLGLRRYALLDAVKGRLGAHRAEPPWLEQLVRARLVDEWQELSGETEAIAVEVAAQGFFTLVPEGTRVPEWRLYVSARPDSDTPALNREIARLADDLGAYVYYPEDDETGDLDAWNEFVDIVEASPLTGATNPSALFEADPPFTAPTTLPGALVDCGVISGLEVALLPLITDAAESIHEATLAAIAMDERGRRVNSIDPDTGELEPSIIDAAAELSTLSSEIYGMVMLDAPALRCRIRAVEDWFWDAAFGWEAYDRPTSTWVPIEQLSLAQRRWAAIAIHAAIATRGPSSARGFVVLDEPESALHPTAQAHLAAGLSQLTERTEARTLVATHSPALLDQPGINVIHVRRGSGGSTELVTLDAISRDQISDLGLRPSDLLQMQRTILLVEGQHDYVILRELLGTELDRERAWIIPVRGGARLEAVIDSQMLCEYTQARLVAVLDNLDAEQVRGVWEEASARARDGDIAEAIAVLQRLDKRKAENRFVIEFGAKAFTAGWHERVTIHGFREADVLYYLPAAHFVRGVSSWVELLERHRNDATKMNFKDWLAKAHGVDLSDDNLRAAVRRLDAIPPEFTELLDIARGLSRVPPPPAAPA
jgi:energy-coupling factor transporter ATP-binding protein EcfA2